MQVGQLILLKNIDRIGGRKQQLTKTIRPAIVREVLGENIVNVRLVSTIYVNENVKPKNIKEAKEAIANNLKNVLPHEKQHIILTLEEDGVLNFSYVYGNMYTDTIDLNSMNHVILRDPATGNPIIISLDSRIKIEEKEIEALTENIIKEYKVEFKRKVKDGESISV